MRLRWAQECSSNWDTGIMQGESPNNFGGLTLIEDRDFPGDSGSERGEESFPGSRNIEYVHMKV